MNKGHSPKFVGYLATILAAAIIAAALPTQAFCQIDGTVLMLQQSPVQGGSITPNIGVHNFARNEQVILTAVPRPGYQFVYWIGDVSDPTVNRTSVYLDSPKIVIAVFERSQYDFIAMDALSKSIPYGGMMGSPRDYAGGGGSGGIGQRPRSEEGPHWPQPPEPTETDFPVSGEDDTDTNDFPVPEPIPEPTTISLLALGSIWLLKKRGKTFNDKRIN